MVISEWIEWIKSFWNFLWAGLWSECPSFPSGEGRSIENFLPPDTFLYLSPILEGKINNFGSAVSSVTTWFVAIVALEFGFILVGYRFRNHIREGNGKIFYLFMGFLLLVFIVCSIIFIIYFKIFFIQIDEDFRAILGIAGEGVDGEAEKSPLHIFSADVALACKGMNLAFFSLITVTLMLIALILWVLFFQKFFQKIFQKDDSRSA